MMSMFGFLKVNTDFFLLEFVKSANQESGEIHPKMLLHILSSPFANIQINQLYVVYVKFLICLSL